MEFMQLRDAIKLIETPVDGKAPRFSVRFITYDEQRGTGGEVLKFDEVTLVGVKDAPRFQIPDEFRRQQPMRISLSRGPNHRANKTKNVRLKNGQVRKIHLRFITHINGIQIIQ